MQRIASSQSCPYCNAPLELLIDPADHGVEYIEDCQVCCQPIRLRAEIDADAELISLSLMREDD